MPELGRWLGQGLFYAVAALLTGYFAQSPRWTSVLPDQGQLVISFAHGAERVAACRRLTPEEIASLPAAARRPNTCERKRLPVRLVVEIDGALFMDRMFSPTGLWQDGPARVYEKFVLSPGRKHLVLRLEDKGRSDHFAYVREAVIDLRAGRKIGVDFKADQGGFLIYG